MARRKANIAEKTAIVIQSRSFHGGLEGDRTLDLTDANRTLSQLSYEPLWENYSTTVWFVKNISFL